MSNSVAPKSHRTPEFEPLLVKHGTAQRMLDCGPVYYWTTLVKPGKIIVVGKGKGGRAYVPSIKSHVEQLVQDAPAVRATLLPPGVRKADGVRVRRAEPRRKKANEEIAVE
jgi:hypothetical protein